MISPLTRRIEGWGGSAEHNRSSDFAIANPSCLPVLVKEEKI
jgi:hypothetical protein